MNEKDWLMFTALASRWAREHREQTGHDVWTNFRGPEDFHMQCFECVRVRGGDQ